jgi:hypothetical protein
MGKLLIALFIGLIAGGVLTFYFFVGVPSAGRVPGSLIGPPDDATRQARPVRIVLEQDAFNNVLNAIFRDMNPPVFPLGGQAVAAGACASSITVLSEGSGVQTGLRMENNTFAVPLAFSGSYDSPFGCLQFTGWAQATFDLRYDAGARSVLGQINVETVNLDNVNPVIGVLLTPIVQSTLNQRVNPIRILESRQIAMSLPIQATGGTLQANVKDIRAEVRDNALNLYLIYEFTGIRTAEVLTP